MLGILLVLPAALKLRYTEPACIARTALAVMFVVAVVGYLAGKRVRE